MQELYIKSYKTAIKFDEKMWAKIEGFFQENFSKTHAVITLRKDMGVIREGIDYVYGYAKRNADNIKSIAVHGEDGDMMVSMTFFTSKNKSPISLIIEAENIDKKTREKMNAAIADIHALSPKATIAYQMFKGILGTEIYMLLAYLIINIMPHGIWALLLALLASVPFWFILFVFDFAAKRKETADEWVQFWVDDEHRAKYSSIKGWKLWQYIAMGLAAALPVAAFAFLAGL